MKPLLVFFIAIFSIQNSIAQDVQQNLDSLFLNLNERDQFTGNVLVVNQGQLIYKKSFGLADRTRQVPLDENTLFNTASVSKVITATAIMQLSENGRIIIDENVKNYLPDFPYATITVGHLLTHASGLPEKKTLLSDYGNKELATNDKVMKILYSEKPELLFSPGTKSVFNDVGYIVLSEIIQNLTEMEYAEYIQQYIFDPSGMVETGIYNATEIPSKVNAAKGYLFSPFSESYVEPIKSVDFGNLYAESGTEGDANVWSTTGDLLHFCSALSAGLLLSEESVNTMFLKKTDAFMPGQERSYGNSFSYGWIIPEAPFRIAQTKGELPGFNAQITWNLTEKRMIIYLSNNYLSFTSYNNLVPYTVGAIVTQNTFSIPKKWASVELTNVVLHSSDKEIADLVEKMKNEPETYDFDIPAVQFLVDRLNDMGEAEKASLVERLVAE